MSTESAPSVRRKYLLFTIFTVISFALDQWTKILARHHLRPLGSRNAKVVVQDWFDLRYAEQASRSACCRTFPAGGCC